MTDEAHRQAAEILSAATDQYRVHFELAELLVKNVDDPDPEDETEQIRADATIHATLANAAATMAAAMVAFLGQE